MKTTLAHGGAIDSPWTVGPARPRPLVSRWQDPQGRGSGGSGDLSHSTCPRVWWAAGGRFLQTCGNEVDCCTPLRRKGRVPSVRASHGIGQPSRPWYHPEVPLSSMSPYYNRRKKSIKALDRTFYPAHHRYAGMPIGGWRGLRHSRIAVGAGLGVSHAYLRLRCSRGGDSNVAFAIFKGLMAKSSSYSLITRMSISQLCWRGLRSGMER